jgi:glycosyltransferase involved in cell wall biosynthesis
MGIPVHDTYFQPFDWIVFPIIEWFFRFQRPQQLTTGMARHGHRVFYLRTSFGAGPQPVCRPIRDDLPMTEVQLGGDLRKNLCTDQLDDSSIQSLLDQFAGLRETHRITKAVCMVNLPFWGPLALRLKQAFGWKVVYDCLDHMGGFSLFSDFALEPEEELAKNSDLLLATSRLLFAENRRLNPNCMLVPNGTEYDHFHTPPVGVHSELQTLPRPIIGYYGAIDDWFDAGLVYRLAQARPGWSFVLIGDTARSDLSKIAAVKNIHLLGEQPYELIPGYLQHFDVCIIPFKKTPLTDATNPVKLFEYLSAGKSIVAADLEELRHYPDQVRLASSDDEWLSALDRALKDYPPKTVEARYRFARRNTWDERVSVIEDAVQDIYRKLENRTAPLPPLFPRKAPLSSRLLARHDGVEYWCRMYRKGDVLYKQTHPVLAEREVRFLSRLSRKYFPKPSSVQTGNGYSVIVFEHLDGQTLREAQPVLSASAAALHRFIGHCLNLLADLKKNRVVHRNICRENLTIRAGRPVLMNLEWAVSPEEPFFAPEGLGGSERSLQGGFSDVFSMGKILAYVNRHRFLAFDRVISLMTAEDPALRITDLDILRVLFANAMIRARKERP